MKKLLAATLFSTLVSFPVLADENELPIDVRQCEVTMQLEGDSEPDSENELVCLFCCNNSCNGVWQAV